MNLSLSELVTGGPGLDAMHEAHHGHHHQIPGADLQPDEDTAEDEVTAHESRGTLVLRLSASNGFSAD